MRYAFPKSLTAVLMLAFLVVGLTGLPVGTPIVSANGASEEMVDILPGGETSAAEETSEGGLPGSDLPSAEASSVDLDGKLPGGFSDSVGLPGVGDSGLAMPGAKKNGQVVSASARFEVDPVPQDPAKPRTGVLSITATPKRGWYFYSITQPPGGPVAAKLRLEPSDAFRVTGDYVPDHPPKRKFEDVFNMEVETFPTKVTWRAPIEFAPGVDVKQLTVRGALVAQPCTAGACQAPQPFAFSAAYGGVLKQAPSAEAAAPSPAPAAGPAAKGDGTFLGEIEVEDEWCAGCLHWALIYGFLGGIILNVMPCVLPVIGLKILSFAEQAGQNRSYAFLLNLWYSAGLLSIFLLLATLAVFAGYGWGQLFQLEWFNVAMAAIVFVLALSFLGVWEVPIPGFASTSKASELSQKEGAFGAFAKGVLTTILATPCSAPFLGAALVWTLRQPPAVVYAVFTSMALGMAFPYLLIGMFPRLSRFIPKPGPWMETFKEAMGFVLLGTVVFVLMSIQSGNLLATVAFLFGLWPSCWWIGRMPFTAAKLTKLRCWMEAIVFATLIWIVAFGWLAEAGPFEKPTLATESAAAITDTTVYEFPGHPEPFSQARLVELVQNGQPVMVDFTADWCLTCKMLEKAVLHTDDIVQAVRDLDIAFLQADWTDADPEVTAMLSRLRSKQVPVIAIFSPTDPAHPKVFRGGYGKQAILDALNAAAKPSEVKEESAAELPVAQ